MRTWKHLAALLCLAAIAMSTTVTFYVDHEVEQPLDYVQIEAIVKTNDESLEKALSDAAGIVAEIKKIVDIYCHTYAKDKTQCLDIIEVSAESMKPQYEIVKKKPQFAGFVVANQILIKVKESPSFGKLVDDILKIGVDKINSLEWKPYNEVDGDEEAVEQGIAQAHQICKKIGMTLDKIVSVQEVTDFGQDEQEQQQGEGEKGGDGEGQEEEEQEQEEQEEALDINDDITYFKFVVQCVKKQK